MSDALLSNVRRPRCTPCTYLPSTVEVETLLSAAASHPLGLDFLRDGSLDSVAATFRVHAFTVVAARERLATSRLELA
jgi:hypothetical protein